MGNCDNLFLDHILLFVHRSNRRNGTWAAHKTSGLDHKEEQYLAEPVGVLPELLENLSYYGTSRASMVILGLLQRDETCYAGLVVCQLCLDSPGQGGRKTTDERIF
jgi:hypothetical protein